MNDCAGCMLLVVVENEILFTAALSICSGHKYGYIQVKIMTAVIAVSIPSKSYKDLFSSRVIFGQINLLTLC